MFKKLIYLKGDKISYNYIVFVFNKIGVTDLCGCKKHYIMNVQ